jgi:hypothetical protein
MRWLASQSWFYAFRWLFSQLWFYALLYVGLIVVFAAIFSAMPGQFYHSTTSFEPETGKFKDRLQVRLAKDIKRNISPAKPDAPEVGPWKITSVLVSELTLRDKWVVASTYLMGMDSKPPMRRFEAMFNLGISAKGSVKTSISQPVRDAEGQIVAVTNPPILNHREAEITNLKVNGVESMPVLLSDLFPCRSSTRIYPLCVELEEDADRDIEALVLLLTGQPESGMDSFWRMLYFSVVTITTLGFGDIVPVTRVARGLVTFEAFLGPLLLGCFLAAIGSRIGPSHAHPAGGGPGGKMAEVSHVQDGGKKERRTHRKRR